MNTYTEKPVVESGTRARHGPLTRAELLSWFKERARVRDAEQAARHTGCTPAEAADRFRSGHSLVLYSSGRYGWHPGQRVGKLWRE